MASMAARFTTGRGGAKLEIGRFQHTHRQRYDGRLALVLLAARIRDHSRRRPLDSGYRRVEANCVAIGLLSSCQSRR